MKRKLIIILMSLVTFATSMAQDDVVLSCPDDNHPHAIDLGLPTGTKWACCNVGATKPEEYGDYFQWGKTQETNEHNSNTSLHYNGNTSTSYNFDGNIVGTEFDVAHVKWGGEWKMPSWDKSVELTDQCSFEWVIVNGISGGRFIGPNGNSVFLPSCGSYGQRGLIGCGIMGAYWTGTKRPPYYPYVNNDAYSFGFYSPSEGGRGANEGWSDCYHSLSVRPVIGGLDKIPLILSTDTLILSEFNRKEIKITSGYGELSHYEKVSSNTDVASVEVLFKVEGSFVEITSYFAGEATITVKDISRGQEAEIKVIVKTNCPDDNHPHIIDLGLPSGTKWACCNVGASSPRQCGGYYAWGETEEKELYDYSTYIHCDGTYGTCHDLGESICGTIYDVARVKWGEGWQMPSLEQTVELMNGLYSCETNSFDSSEKGIKMFKKEFNYIYFPYTGWYQSNGFQNPKIAGSYWTGTKSYNDSNGAYNFAFIKSGIEVDNYWLNSRAMGHPVRPVYVGSDAITNVAHQYLDVRAVYNICGIKVADNLEQANNLPPGIYIVNGKKMVIK